MSKPKHERTRDIQKSLENRERFPISYFDSRKYIQHNVNLADGLGAILTLMDGLPAHRTKVEALRSFEDGDFSVGHFDYLLGDWGAMIGFEVHRWEDERIVEHWDNLQSRPTALNPSGRSMSDGAIEVTDLDKTDANKTLVRDYTQRVLIGGDVNRISRYHTGDRLIQHSPWLGDGTLAVATWILKGLHGSGGPVYERLHLLLGQGNMILTVSEGAMIDADARRPAAFYDLYRVDAGTIAEHWDVLEIIPPRDTWKNDNGKF